MQIMPLYRPTFLGPISDHFTVDQIDVQLLVQIEKASSFRLNLSIDQLWGNAEVKAKLVKITNK